MLVVLEKCCCGGHSTNKKTAVGLLVANTVALTNVHGPSAVRYLSRLNSRKGTTPSTDHSNPDQTLLTCCWPSKLTAPIVISAVWESPAGGDDKVSLIVVSAITTSSLLKLEMEADDSGVLPDAVLGDSSEAGSCLASLSAWSVVSSPFFCVSVSLPFTVTYSQHSRYVAR